jgi:hypothetical protein
MATSNPSGRACDERLGLIQREERRTGGGTPWAGGELTRAPLPNAPKRGSEGLLA